MIRQTFTFEELNSTRAPTALLNHISGARFTELLLEKPRTMYVQISVRFTVCRIAKCDSLLPTCEAVSQTCSKKMRRKKSFPILLLHPINPVKTTKLGFHH